MPKLDLETMNQRRQHILDAALRQFEVQGFGAASVDSICAEAKVSKGALYTHFRSKDEIMLEILKRRGDVYKKIQITSLDEFEQTLFDLMLRGLSYVDSRLEMEAVAIGASNKVIENALIDNTSQLDVAISRSVNAIVTSGAASLAGDISIEEASKMIQAYILGRLSMHLYETENLDSEARRGLRIIFSAVFRPV